jgi:ATP-dependent Clp protease ATP-binding subunit ClpC
LDENHVGTEHVVLGLLADHEGIAATALTSLGITRRVFLRQLHEEKGDSPVGRIPITPRALKIIALAGVEADHFGHRFISTGHVLLGVVRESEEWAASGKAGPHHLQKAAETVGHTLADVRGRVLELLDKESH